MVNFPTSVVNFLQLQDGVDRIIALHPNSRGDEITAIQTMLGAMGAGQAYSESYKNVLLNYIRGCKCEFKDATSFYVRTGEIVIGDGGTGVRFRRNVSDITADFTMLDTGSVAANTTYYVYAVADISGTTFTVKISTNSSAPSGSSFYRKIGTVITNGASEIDDGAVSSFGSNIGLGSWQTKDADTVYQAFSDGFLVATVTGQSPSFGDIILYTDDNASPSTIRSSDSLDRSDSVEDYVKQGGVFSPVRAGDYYKVSTSFTGSVSVDVYFIPLQ